MYTFKLSNVSIISGLRFIIITIKNLKMSPQPSLIVAKRANTFTDLRSYIDASRDASTARFKTKRIRPSAYPVIPGDTLAGTPRPSGDMDVPIGNMSAYYPVVIIPGLPADEYPKYMSFLARASMARMLVSDRALADTLDTGFGRAMACLAVAVRCGVWAALGFVPTYDSVCNVAKYRLKDGMVYRIAMSECRDQAAWYYAYDSTAAVSERMEELMHRVAHVAPVFLDMECAEMARQAVSYASPYVERGISSYLRAKLSPEAYAIANLDKPLVWSLLRQAAVLGQAEANVKHWATDAVFHIQAHRRVLSTTAEVVASRRREEACRAKSSHVMIETDDAQGYSIDTDFAAAVRAARPRPPSDDLESIAGFSTWDTTEQDLSGASTPVGAYSWDKTAAPSRVATPPPAMTTQEADQIRSAVAGAAASGERAVSEMMGAADDQTVAW